MADHKCTKEPVFTRLFVNQEGIKKDLGHLKKTLEGNGSPGLIEKADIAHDFIIKQKEKKESECKIDSWSRKRFVVVGGLVYVVLQIILETFKKHFGG